MKKRSNLARLMDYAGKYRYLTYLSLFLSILSAVLALFPYIFLYAIIRIVIAQVPVISQAAGIVRLGWMTVGAALLSMAVYFAALMCSHLSAFRLASNIRKTLLARLAELPDGFIEETGSGKIRRIVNDSSAATETYLAHQLPDMAAAVTTPICMVVMLFVFDWRFGLVTFVPILLGFACMYKMAGPSMAQDMKQYMDALADMNNEAVEYVRGIPVVKTFGQTVHSFRRFKAAIEAYHKYCISYCRKCRPSMLAYTLFIHSAFAFLIALALFLSRQHTADQQVLSGYCFYVIFTPLIATAMSKVMYMSENGMIVSDALTRIQFILGQAPLSQPASPRIPADRSVTFEDVTFRYSEDAANALDHVSFHADPGQIIALVGPSGGGKSTAAKLATRFRDVSGGLIRIGGVDIKDIAGGQLQDTVACVFQDIRLLKASILDNVRMGRPDATRQEVTESLHEAGCDDILAKLEGGIDTVIGTEGVWLSGGEQQRIAIARTILKDAPILILDEATAFADPENEALVQRSIERLARNKTVIMIAHRLTTIRKADCIYVLQDGKVTESGTHDKLVAQDGVYARMWQDYQTSAKWKVGGAK